MSRKTLGVSVGLSDMRDDLISIIGYAGEFSEANSSPVRAFYTDRYLSPVLDELIEYIEVREARARKEERDDYGDHMYDVGYRRGVDDTNAKHDRLCVPPIVTRRETIVDIIRLLSLCVPPEDGTVPMSRIAESDEFLRAME